MPTSLPYISIEEVREAPRVSVWGILALACSIVAGVGLLVLIDHRFSRNPATAATTTLQVPSPSSASASPRVLAEVPTSPLSSVLIYNHGCLLELGTQASRATVFAWNSPTAGNDKAPKPAQVRRAFEIQYGVSIAEHVLDSTTKNDEKLTTPSQRSPPQDALEQIHADIRDTFVVFLRNVRTAMDGVPMYTEILIRSHVSGLLANETKTAIVSGLRDAVNVTGLILNSAWVEYLPPHLIGPAVQGRSPDRTDSHDDHSHHNHQDGPKRQPLKNSNPLQPGDRLDSPPEARSHKEVQEKRPDDGETETEENAAHRKADEILANAHEEASRIVERARHQVLEMERALSDRMHAVVEDLLARPGDSNEPSRNARPHADAAEFLLPLRVLRMAAAAAANANAKGSHPNTVSNPKDKPQDERDKAKEARLRGGGDETLHSEAADPLAQQLQQVAEELWHNYVQKEQAFVVPDAKPLAPLTPPQVEDVDDTKEDKKKGTSK